MKKVVGALCLLCLSCPVLFGFETLETIGPKLYSAPLTVPATEKFSIYELDAAGAFTKSEGTSVWTTNPDGTLTLEGNSTKGSQKSVFLPDGRLVSSLQKSLASKTTFLIEVSQDRKNATFSTAKEGKAASKKTVKLKPEHMLNPELRVLIQQAAANGIRDGISVKGCSPDGAMEASMEIKLTLTNDPLSLTGLYAYPAGFRAGLPSGGEYVVGDMYLTGIASSFYRHHNYFIFQNTGAGVEYIAYFGDDPKKPSFQLTE
jgi:hypothetical protein